MFYRQRTLLFLLKQVGSQATKIQLMKWAFLLAQETPSHGGNVFYHFVPYLYGPYSFTLVQETDSFIRDGLLEPDDEVYWKLSQTAKNATLDLPKSVIQDIRFVVARYGKLSNQELINLIYKKYPWFTLNSQIVAQVTKRPTAEPAIYTIGYEGITVDEFLDNLLRLGIHQVIDVRNNPISRRYGFHKNTLSRLCGLLRINYIHIPNLGIPSSERENIHSSPQYKALFEDYKNGLDHHLKDIQDVIRLISMTPSVLVCKEAAPNLCHRSTLAEYLATLTDLPVKHLGWPR